MIQKRNISNFAIGLCLLALMLLSASPAEAFKTTDSSMMAAYDSCLNAEYKGKAKKVKECFRQFKVKFSSACLIDESTLNKELTKNNDDRIIISVDRMTQGKCRT